MKALIAILAVILVLGGLAFWIFVGQDEEAGFDAARNDAEFERDEAVEARRHVGSAEVNGPIAEAESGASSVQVQIPPARPIEGGLLVRCVFKETGAPVPGAEAFVREGRTGSDPRVAPGTPTVTEFHDFGTRYRADSEGLVWLPPSAEFQRVIALTDGQFGGPVNFRTGEIEELILEMVPRRAIMVEVVDAGGEPRSGVEVTLRRLYGSRNNVSNTEIVATDAAGRASLDLSPIVASGYTAGFDLLVGIVGTFREPVEIAIDPYLKPTEVVRLVLPPCGRVVIRAEPAAPDAGSWIYLLDPDQGGRYRRNRFEGKEAVFETIGLGLDLRISYHPAEGSNDSRQSFERPGPTTDGETVEIVLDRDAVPRRAVLTALLVDADGEVLAGKTVDLRRFEGAARVAEWRVESADTDRSGRLTIGLGEISARTLASNSWAMVVQGDVGRPLVHRMPAQAFPVGTTDLGTIAMENLPLVVAGRVVDDRGVAIRGARLSIERRRTDRSRGRLPFYGGLTAVSDAEGRFEIRDVYEFNELQLRAWKTDHVSTSIVCVPGSSDVVLTLRRRSRVRLHCETASGAPVTGLRFEHLPDGDPARRQSAPVPENGELEIIVEAGRHDMRLVRAGTYSTKDAERLAEWPGIDIEAGETRDLGSVAVPERGIDVEVAIDLVEAASPGHFQFRVLEVGGETPIRSGYIRGNAGRVVRFNVDNLPVDLEVFAEGAGLARKTIHEAKERIEIGPGLKIGLRFHCADRGLTGSMVYCHLVDRKGNYCAGMGWVNGDVTWFVVPAPGSYGVMPSVDSKQLPPKAKDADIRLYEPATIEVKGGEKDRVVTVTFHEDLRKHLE